MKLKHVTLTGADDRTDIEQMRRISAQYPFVEWGILFSKNSDQKSRYPSMEWVQRLRDTELTLSVHLCGKLVDDVLAGTLSLVDIPENDLFHRIQLNMSGNRLKLFLTSDVWKLNCHGRNVIVGGNFESCEFAVPKQFFIEESLSLLFDGSGGRGIDCDCWPEPVSEIFCGYAGGLGPENISSQLKSIADVAGDNQIWIDMESKIRTGSDLDFDKCKSVLEMCCDYV